MKIYELHCQDPWFSLLKEGAKSVEGRINKAPCSQIKPGDQILFYNDQDKFFATVIKVQHFISLSEYLETVGLQSALPGISSIKEGCNVYLKFYSEEEIQKSGMLAFFVNRNLIH
jgi:ASC-1-like (ASCH) protein